MSLMMQGFRPVVGPRKTDKRIAIGTLHVNQSTAHACQQKYPADLQFITGYPMSKQHV